LTFAILGYGNSQVFLNAGGLRSTAARRDIDLYVRTENVDQLHEALKQHVEICRDLENTFYGTREFSVRDVNGFWVTFGQDLPSAEVV
jgi:uncharacterized glyoxalase superfamily protein PhnB